MENRPVSTGESAIFGTYQGFLQSFFMGFLFFIAGYFVPGAYDSKGSARFIRDRLFRLGLPLLFFVFVLQPVSIWCISLFHGEDVGGNLGQVYTRYITHNRWIGGTGPLWFCEALLLFCVGYMIVRKLSGKTFRSIAGKTGAPSLLTTAAAQLTSEPAPASPGNTFPFRTKIAAFILSIALCTWLIRIPWPNGTSFYNLQFCYFPQYIFFFIAGTLAWRGDWLNKLSSRDGKWWGRVGLFGGLALWVAILVLGGAFEGKLDLYKGGGSWQSFAMSLWEQVAGVGISIFLLFWFRQRFNRQGRIAAFFSANAFAVYVFHTPILITISRIMSGLSWPLLIMFLVLTTLGTAVTWLLSGLVLRKIPLLKNIL